MTYDGHKIIRRNNIVFSGERGHYTSSAVNSSTFTIDRIEGEDYQLKRQRISDSRTYLIMRGTIDDCADYADSLSSSRIGSVDDRLKMKLLLVWLQQRDIHPMNYKLGEKPELCTNATELVDQFCSELGPKDKK